MNIVKAFSKKAGRSPARKSANKKAPRYLARDHVKDPVGHKGHDGRMYHVKGHYSPKLRKTIYRWALAK